MNLIRYEGYNLTIEPEMLLIKPFKALWNRDKSKTKETALMELGYIYFMCDPRSDYMYLLDEDDRHKAVIEGEGLDSKWKPDATLIEAMDYYKSIKPLAAILLDDLRVAVGKIREHLKTLDLTAVDRNGKPIYTLDSYTKVTVQLTSLINELNNTEKKLYSTMTEDEKIRGNVEKSMFEDE